ncbi:hypothetical protein DdX_17751 [Ditylenchus destructor]|uniref:Uncharacterized protein n=1 Tax=Ditylenchus destructor TaxID=166010 RepID=A0AAD4MM03_9BILA|nr:hypothetical protein DdX_17751 [Ditylenchus destructor]
MNSSPLTHNIQPKVWRKGSECLVCAWDMCSCMGNVGWLPGSMAHEMPQSPHLYAGWPAGLGLWHLRTGLRWNGSWGGSFLFSLHSESIHLSMSRRGRLGWLGPDRDLLAFQRAGEMNRRLRCTKVVPDI